MGIVGLKPTFGLVPYTGIVSNEISVDHTGPMTRDVMSNAELLHVIAGVDGIDDRQIAGTPFPGSVPNYPALLSAAQKARTLLTVDVPPSQSSDVFGTTRRLRVGILKEGETILNMDPRVAACVRAATERFTELGADVVEINVPEHSLGLLIGRVHRYYSSS